jgi:hypothetical protein
MRRREFIAVLNPRVLAVGLAAFAFFWNVRFRHRHRSTLYVSCFWSQL